jgi:hypothetical protein
VMIADKLFESYLSFKLKVLVAAIAAAAGLLAFAPQAQAQLLTPQQVAERQAVSPPSLAYPYTNGKPKSGYCGTAAHVYHHGYQ